MDQTEKERVEEEVLNNPSEEATQEEPQAEERQEGTELSEEEKLKEELAKAQEENASMQDKYLRLSAEFDNYRKRTLKEKSELIKSASERVITDILPVLDDLERALQNMQKSEEANALAEGVELIHGKFLKVLSQQGLKKIETEGKEFDTDYHEAIAMIPASSEEMKGKILDCVQTGYTLNDKVIRHAKVAVAQ